MEYFGIEYEIVFKFVNEVKILWVSDNLFDRMGCIWMSRMVFLWFLKFLIICIFYRGLLSGRGFVDDLEIKLSKFFWFLICLEDENMWLLIVKLWLGI